MCEDQTGTITIKVYSDGAPKIEVDGFIDIGILPMLNMHIIQAFEFRSIEQRDVELKTLNARREKQKVRDEAIAKERKDKEEAKEKKRIEDEEKRLEQKAKDKERIIMENKILNARRTVAMEKSKTTDKKLIEESEEFLKSEEVRNFMKKQETNND